jgi:hypothetical protein
MKKYIILVLFAIVFINCKSKNCICEQDISFEILNDSLVDNDTINLKIINNTKTKYFLPFDFNLKKYNKNIQEEYRYYFYPNIGVYKKLNDLKEIDYGISVNSGHYYYNDKEFTFLKSEKDLTTLHPYEEKIIKIPFSNYEKIPNYSIRENIYCLKNGIYFLELEYYIDSKVTTKLLKEKFNIKSDYKCFNGRIVSNRVILFISKQDK